MGVKAKASVAALFETGDKPTQDDFADLIDSAVFIPTAGATGIVEIESTASATTRTLGAVGVLMIEAAATASARGHLGAGTVGIEVFIADTTASVQGGLGLTVGTDVQAYDALLASLAGQTVAANKVQGYSGVDTATLFDFLDEDNMASNSATAVASQQSVKAYVDDSVGADILIYSDREAAGTAAGDDHSSGAWRTMTVADEDADTGNNGTLASNQITLAAGTYDVDIWLPIHANASTAGQYMARLYNVTGTTSVAESPVTESEAASAVPVPLRINARFTIAASQALEIQAYGSVNFSNATTALSWTEDNVALVAKFTRIS